MNPDTPSTFPRRVLVASVGRTPQVITETLFALARQAPPFVPTEIHVVTTADGASVVAGRLLGDDGHLMRFADDFALPFLSSALTHERIHVISTPDGTPLADIIDETSNAATADLITQLLRELTADPTSALHVSIAGGRKTMTLLMGMALSLFGRPQDRLSHVLVSPPAFETHPEFFYPPPEPRTLELARPHPDVPSGGLSTAEARIKLGEVPFVRLRNGQPEDLLGGRASYSETVARAQSAFQAPDLSIDITQAIVRANDVDIRMEPQLFALYAAMAEAIVSCDADVGFHWSVGETADRILSVYGRIGSIGLAEFQRLRTRLATDDGLRSFLEQTKARVNGLLKSHLGQAAQPYVIGTVGRVPDRGAYRLSGLTLPPEAVTMIDAD